MNILRYLFVWFAIVLMFLTAASCTVETDSIWAISEFVAFTGLAAWSLTKWQEMKP